MDKIKTLRGFIIRNFIIILLIVVAAEMVTVLILNRLIFPLFSPLLFGRGGIRSYDVTTVLVFFLYLLVRAVLFIVSRFIPIGINHFDDKLIASITLFKGNVLAEQYDSNSIWIKLFLIALIIAVIMLIVFPPLMAGAIFTGRVVSKFSLLEKEEAKRKALYEQKRNLMISDIAHDLRTPITTIYGYSQAILDEKADPDKVRDYLNLISMKSKKVDELINLLFDYVKLDSEGFTLHKERTDLSELARQAGALLYQDVTDAGMELAALIPEEEIPVDADKVQLSRVINNLISNAIKHNPAGTKIGLIILGDEKKWSLYVADSGEPIDEKAAENLFEPFVTGDESRTSKGGTGLGLSIAHKIAILHGFDLKLLQGWSVPADVRLEGFTKCFEISSDNKNI